MQRLSGAVREFCEENDISMMTLFAFNEWTEGSYLEPDERYGTAFADVVKDVFNE